MGTRGDDMGPADADALAALGRLSRPGRAALVAQTILDPDTPRNSGPFSYIHNVKARAFLAVYSILGNLSAASRVVGVDRTMHSYWMGTNRDGVGLLDGYRDAFSEAQEMAADSLEDAAWRRAVDGVDKPIYQRGELVGTERVYSDRLLELLLGGARPEKYKRRIVDQTISGPGGGPVKVWTLGAVASLSEAQLSELAARVGTRLLPDRAGGSARLPVEALADGENGDGAGGDSGPN